MAIDYHEPVAELSAHARDVHRALTTLVEELEAVAWYNQRLEVSPDAELRAILEHNRNEEIEHACMALEWLRRTMPEFDENMKTYLFTTAPITEVEELAEAGEAGGDAAPAGGEGTGLGIGSSR